MGSRSQSIATSVEEMKPAVKEKVECADPQKSKKLAPSAIFGLSDSAAANRLNETSKKLHSTSFMRSIQSLMEETKPVVLDEGEFENRQKKKQFTKYFLDF